MLGGFAKLHTPDIAISKTFINSLKSKKLLHNFDYALDCGAGIGRVTKHLLMPLFSTVDLVDVVEDFIVKSDEYIGHDNGIGEKFVEGLQTFTPPEKRYDLIWIQWVSGHLTDEDLAAFFRRCTNQLFEIFDDAGLRLVSRSLQTGFPKEMYPVKLFALKPQLVETSVAK